MRERLALLGGRLKIESSAGRGTTIVAEVPSAMSEIRVLIVDDHAVVRTGLRLLLDARTTSRSSARPATLQRRGLRRRASTKPDVVLMDVVMPGASGIEATPEVLEDAPDAKVLVLSMQDDPRYVREAFAAGASGYVLKEAADTEVVAAVREVAGGGRYVHPALGARLVAAEPRSAGAPRPTRSPTASARCSGCSPSATRTRRSRRRSTSRCARPRRTGRTSCRSSGCTTRAELVRYALEQGLLEPNDERPRAPRSCRWGGETASVAHRPRGLPTLSRPTWPRSTWAKAWLTKG